MGAYGFARCYAEIDLDKLVRNLKRVRAMLGEKCRLMYVVKADAYGHGAAVLARTAAPYVDWFAAATLEEVLELRQAGIQKEILLLGILPEEAVEAALRNQITVCVASVRQGRLLDQAAAHIGQPLQCHLKIDTGMNRLGLRARIGALDCAAAEAVQLLQLEHLHVTGIYTHFSCADSCLPEDEAFSLLQYQTFQELCGRLTDRGYALGLRHCAASGAVLNHPAWKMDMVRTGMLPLGQGISAGQTRGMGFEPILKWCARVVEIRQVAPGESIGYGRICQAERPMELAVIAAGYGDGYSRSYSNRAMLIANGALARICGKICMDYCMADVTGLGVHVGDDVVLLGAEGAHWISADYLSGLIDHGVNGWTTGMLTKRVPRIYLRGGKVVDRCPDNPIVGDGIPKGCQKQR